MLDSNVSVRKQALLICRSGLYYKSIINDYAETANLLNEIYLASDCRYGYRKITAELKASGIEVNSKKYLE